MLDEEKRSIEYVKETAEYIRTVDGYMSASALCEEFLFDSTLQYQKIGKLSGGEKKKAISVENSCCFSKCTDF